MKACIAWILLAGVAPHAVAADAVVAPAIARPGDAVLVRVHAPAAALAAATLGGRPIRFWPHGDESWAIAALPIETASGPVRLELAPEGPDRRVAATVVEVVEPGFPSRALTLARKYVEPPPSVRARIARDRAAIEAAYARPFVPPLFSRNFDWPRRAPTSGRFGDQRVLNGKTESVHYGLDIEGPRGAPVRAANDGEVVLARDCYLSGKTVVVWHGADLFTLYFHLDRMDVRAGAKIRRGERVGLLGSTGRSTGPHLHWSARAAGLLIDPESLLGIDFITGAAPARRAGPAPRAAELSAPAPPR